MKRKFLAIWTVIALASGVSFLMKGLPGGVPGNAYATPSRGTDCSKCHKSRTPTPKGFKGFTNSFMLETCDGFSSSGSNPYFVLKPGFQLTLEGVDKKQNVHLTITVLDETKTFNDLDLGGGVVTDVVTRVVEERETRDGLLAEVSRNYFALCNRTNSVFYFGEDVDLYEGGVLVSQEGSWLAGVDEAKPGIMMPGVILLGGKYFQEVAPGVALDRAEIISMTETVETPAGTFENCLKTLETSALEKGKGYKYYAPGIGLIKEGALELISYSK